MTEIPEKERKLGDPDYRVLHKYLNAHDASPYFHAALERLIERAGVRVDYFFKQEPKKPRLVKSEIRRLVEQGKTQSEITKIYRVGIDTLRRFMRENGIEPSHTGKGTYKREPIKAKAKPVIMEVRHDPDFPVPIQVIRPGYGAASQAARV